MIKIKYVKSKFFIGYIVYDIILLLFNFTIWPFLSVNLYNNFLICNMFPVRSLFCFYYSFISTFSYFSTIFFVSYFYDSNLMSNIDAINVKEYSKSYYYSKKLLKSRKRFISFLILYFLFILFIFNMLLYAYTVREIKTIFYCGYRISHFLYIDNYSFEYIILFSSLNFLYFISIFLFHIIFPIFSFVFEPIQKHIWRLK
jgi:hypothetical protein